MSEARVSMATELRAPKGFAALYEGRSCDIPVVLSPYASGLDPQAEKTLAALKNEYNKNKSYPIQSNFENGVGPFLIGGVPVPMYSSVALHVPSILALVADAYRPYTYVLIWRVRTFATSVSGNGVPFHARNSSPGPNFDGQGQVVNPAPGGAVWSGKCQTRFPIYAANNSIVYAQSEPTTNDAAFQNVYASFSRVIRVDSQTNTELPLFNAFEPGQYATGEITQGFSSTVAGKCSHITYLERAMGDELCVLVYREPAAEGDSWNFGGTDASFLNFYSQDIASNRGRNYGILVNTGAAP